MRRAAYLVLIAVLSCVGYDPGIDVDVVLVTPRATIGAEVQSATLLVEYLELLPCEHPTGTNVPLALGVAYAHGGEVPTDAMDMLEAPRRSLTLLRPAPDEYCTLRLHLGDVEREAATLVRAGGTLSASRQDIDVDMPPSVFHDVGEHAVVLHYDYTQWTDDDSFASSFWVE